VKASGKAPTHMNMPALTGLSNLTHLTELSLSDVHNRHSLPGLQQLPLLTSLRCDCPLPKRISQGCVLGICYAYVMHLDVVRTSARVVRTKLRVVRSNSSTYDLMWMSCLPLCAWSDKHVQGASWSGVSTASSQMCMVESAASMCIKFDAAECAFISPLPVWLHHLVYKEGARI